MKKKIAKKPAPKKVQREARPMELDPNWQELEAQHERMKVDWGSLAAQLGIDGDKEP